MMLTLNMEDWGPEPRNVRDSRKQTRQGSVDSLLEPPEENAALVTP